MIELDTQTRLLLLAFFGLGVVVGYWLRSHVRIDTGRRGHTGAVSTPDPSPSAASDTKRGRLSRLVRWLDRPAFYVLGVLVAIGMGSGSVVLALEANSDAGGAQADFAALTTCVAQYNRDAGDARDERSAQAELDRAAERLVWQTLYDQLSAPQGSVTLDDLLATIAARVAAIDAVDAKALEYPYPDPDRCLTPRG